MCFEATDRPPQPPRTGHGGESERLVAGLGVVRGPERILRQLPRPLSPVAGVPQKAVEACRGSLAAGAKPHGAVRVEAVSGAPRRVRTGVTGAPIEARIVYSRSDQVQVRQARVTCHLSTQGRVLALL